MAYEMKTELKEPCDRAVDAIQDFTKAWQDLTDWIPVTEKLPPDGDIVDIYMGGSLVAQARFFEARYFEEEWYHPTTPIPLVNHTVLYWRITLE